MNKIILTLTLTALGMCCQAQTTTATNWTLTDCYGNSHTLYNELDSNKVVCMFFEMGCLSCITAGKSLETYHKTKCDTNKVKCYYFDYNSGSTCSDVETWKSTNGLTFPSFPNAYSIMQPYGNGMPLIVIAGFNRKIYYKGGWNQAKIEQAIAKAAYANVGMAELVDAASLTIFPNPAADEATLSFNLNTSGTVKIAVTDLLGKNVVTVYNGNLQAGSQQMKVTTDKLSNGLYLVQIETATGIQQVQFNVSK